ncbi:hypothetical protein D7B24_002556 [Verticillium nonalfalfae]|uniref:Uncharacterized protein n=1 Tax=Verticillium nonalfalfae TaxID=1051616 RepID=A0A3M9XXL6_9PEZI|nr:uncharacterized protein D7B24_002556 [Verticillium nonalfalfae]RNJ53019.1 hypothetical protein D7B24_002556 [Verticillium nonalfalfae]
MDDPGYAWPAWKFGMKRADLFTKLHDQYNTFPSSIQDPEAFHHDVFEISSDSRTEDEFHRRMAERRVQRLRELDDSLELAGVEIIANPKLIGTEQWSFAVQLFRTRSLDSLVRYFSSYLPEGYLDRHVFHDTASTASSFDQYSVASTNPSSLDGDAESGPYFFPDDDEKRFMTREPFCINTMATDADLPPSPRSMTTQDDSSPSSPTDLHDHDFTLARLTPARSLSFSGSESDAFRRHLDDDHEEEETSQSDDPDSLATSISDLVESHHADDLYEEENFEAQCPTDIFDTIVESIEMETPTPKQEPPTTSSYLDLKQIPTLRHIPSTTYHTRRENSPSPRNYRSSSPYRGSKTLRRTPDEASSRISKPLPDTSRTRTKGRRRGLD